MTDCKKGHRSGGLETRCLPEWLKQAVTPKIMPRLHTDPT